MFSGDSSVREFRFRVHFPLELGEGSSHNTSSIKVNLVNTCPIVISCNMSTKFFDRINWNKETYLQYYGAVCIGGPYCRLLH